MAWHVPCGAKVGGGGSLLLLSRDDHDGCGGRRLDGRRVHRLSTVGCTSLLSTSRGLGARICCAGIRGDDMAGCLVIGGDAGGCRRGYRRNTDDCLCAEATYCLLHVFYVIQECNVRPHDRSSPAVYRCTQQLTLYRTHRVRALYILQCATGNLGRSALVLSLSFFYDSRFD